ncbi:uncharacterized protein A4U43_C01F200 [Asparagus officinalis]|uniref:C2H2-type domain-containing protein n=1 Tax=Asparagus officinalis TaxID=4686 RepID=A0A5P1FPE9_ASPOF|nr:uncharacterized protein A4U43_C01F200 [Asparagus officinalis]
MMFSSSSPPAAFSAERKWLLKPEGCIGLEGPMRSRAELEELEKELYAERIKAEILTLRISQRRMLEEEARHDLEVSCAVTTEQLRRSREPSQIQVTQGPNDKVTETKRKLPRKIAGPSNNLKLKPDWSCALCQVSITSEKALNDHLQGKKHQAKVAVELSSIKKAPELPLLENKSHNHRSSSTPTPTQENWSCTACGVRTTSVHDLNSHLKGKKHKAKVAELKSNKKSSEPASLQKGSRDRSPTPTYKPTGQVKQGPKGGSKVMFLVDGKLHEVLEEGVFLWCTLCNVKCNSDDVMIQHFGGKKHLAEESRRGR